MAKKESLRSSKRVKIKMTSSIHARKSWTKDQLAIPQTENTDTGVELITGDWCNNRTTFHHKASASEVVGVQSLSNITQLQTSTRQHRSQHTIRSYPSVGILAKLVRLTRAPNFECVLSKQSELSILNKFNDLKQRRGLAPTFFNFTLEYAIEKIKVDTKIRCTWNQCKW